MQMEKKRADPAHINERFVDIPPSDEEVRIELRKVLETIVKTTPLQLAQHDLGAAMAKLGVSFSEQQRDEFWWTRDKNK